MNDLPNPYQAPQSFDLPTAPVLPVPIHLRVRTFLPIVLAVVGLLLMAVAILFREQVIALVGLVGLVCLMAALAMTITNVLFYCCAALMRLLNGK